MRLVGIFGIDQDIVLVHYNQAIYDDGAIYCDGVIHFDGAVKLLGRNLVDIALKAG